MGTEDRTKTNKTKIKNDKQTTQKIKRMSSTDLKDKQFVYPRGLLTVMAGKKKLVLDRGGGNIYKDLID